MHEILVSSTFLQSQLCLPFVFSVIFCITTQVHYKGMCHTVSKQITTIRNAETKLAEVVTCLTYFY